MSLDEKKTWLEERRAGIGSTDAAPLLGLSKWKTPLHVYLSKVEGLPDQDSDRKKWGRLLEEVVAQAYAEETGNPVEPPLQRISIHPKHSILLASLDRTTCHQGEWCNLEIKTSESGEGWGAEWSDEIPQDYLPQVQHQMNVTEYRKTVVAVLIGGNRLRFYLVPKNDKFIAIMQRIQLDFWKLVEARTPPPVDWSHPKTIELVKNMYDVDDNISVGLGQDALELAREFALCRQDKKAAEDKQDRVKAELLVQMGEAAEAILPDGTRFTRRKLNRGGYTVKPTSFVVFNLKMSEALRNDVEQSSA